MKILVALIAIFAFMSGYEVSRYAHRDDAGHNFDLGRQQGHKDAGDCYFTPSSKEDSWTVICGGTSRFDDKPNSINQSSTGDNSPNIVSH